IPFGVIWTLLLLLGPVWVLLNWLASNRVLVQTLTFKDPAWRELLPEAPRLIRGAPWLPGFIGLGGGLLLFNWVVYPQMLTGWPWLKLGALAVTGWMMVLVGMIQVHLVPFMAHQHCPFPVALRRSATVAFLNPFRTFSILVGQIVLLALSLIPPMGFLLPGLYATLSLLSLLILLGDWQDPYEKTAEALRAGA